MDSEDSNEEIDILSDGEEQSISATKQSLEAKSNRMTMDSDVGDAYPSPFESSGLSKLSAVQTGHHVVASLHSLIFAWGIITKEWCVCGWKL